MSFKKELNKRNRKKRLYKKWIKISDKIWDYIIDPIQEYADKQHVKKYSNINYYKKDKILKLLKKELYNELLINGVAYLADYEGGCYINEDSMILTSQYLMYISDSKYMRMYRNYVATKDDTNWTRELIADTSKEEGLSISTVKGKDILVNQIGFSYQIFKDTDVYVIEVNKEEV